MEITREESIRRLTVLRDYLQNLPENAVDFDLSYWARKSKCGTTCCAVGHGAMIPEFQELGLHMKHDILCSGNISTYDELKNYNYYGNFIVYYDDHTGYDAVSKFFGITALMTEHIFCPDEYENTPTFQEVISRINLCINSR